MTRMGLAALLAALVAAAASIAPPSTAGAAPAVLTVLSGDPPVRTLVRLAGGFATVFQFDRAITRVALGDDRLVAFHVDAERGDLTMKPVAASGRTNMVVWAGQAVTLWEITITREERTADIIRVITSTRPDEQGAARGAGTGPPAAGAGSGTAGAASGAAPPGARAGSGPAQSPPPQPASGSGPNLSPAASARPGVGDRPTGPPAPAASAPRAEEPPPAFLQAGAQAEGVEAVFQAVRVRWGIVVRYRIRNRTDAVRFRLQPERILVRAHDRIIPFALVRQTPAQGPRDVLPPGTVETGMMTLSGRMTQIHILFPVFPEGPGLPLMLEAGFTGLHRLMVQPAP